MASAPIRAAQYLRMSTEHQQYSLDNQADAVQRYAQLHGYGIVRTYADPGKSGLLLKHRAGLSQLLKDVMTGDADYAVVLVYDVSRWGRFQDTDESAHYEFICKAAGIPVIYCAETFANDGSLTSMIMKSLKRIMAGEYSRELSFKVYEAKKRIVKLGFRSGGYAGYGLRRMMVAPNGQSKGLLPDGEWKSLATHRVVLVPGPAAEVKVVREIFDLVIKHHSAASIARHLNRQGIPYLHREWTYSAVLGIVRNPKYVGCNAWGRTTQRLGSLRTDVPQQDWITKAGAFRPVVDQRTYDLAQEVMRKKTYWKSNGDLLDDLRRLLAKEGRLSESIIDHVRDQPMAQTFRLRFGSLTAAYRLIGYAGSPRAVNQPLRSRRLRLRAQLMRRIQCIYGGRVDLVRDRPWARARLRFRDGLTVSVLLAYPMRTPLGSLRWCVSGCPAERHFATLIVRCNEACSGFRDFYVLPCITRPTDFRLKDDDQWLRHGVKLTAIEDLESAARAVRAKFNM